LEIIVKLRGPDGSAYSDCFFYIEITELTKKEPCIAFLNCCHHPNVDTDGELCLFFLNKPNKYSLLDILYEINQLLIFPDFAQGYFSSDDFDLEKIPSFSKTFYFNEDFVKIESLFCEASHVDIN
jgi:hypothetical protein